MPKLRLIKPEFWDDGPLGRMPAGARLLFVCTWNLADDFGNLRAESRYIMLRAFGFDESVSARHVGQWIRLLTKSGHLVPYTVDSTGYFHIAGWERHQNMRKAILYRQVAASPFDVIPSGYAWQDEQETVLKRSQKNSLTQARLVGCSSSSPDALVLKGESEGDPVVEVFEYFRAKTAAAKATEAASQGRLRSTLTADKRKHITARLREGKTVDDLKQAVDGCLVHPDYNGANGGTVYDEVDNIFRNGGRTEKLIEAAIDPPKPRQQANPRTANIYHGGDDWSEYDDQA